MGKQLSEMLAANGFLMVLGTKEKNMGELECVGYGVPYSFDTRNNFTAVYDEQGRPWWTKSSKGFFEGEEFRIIFDTMLAQGVTMKRGARVPHLHDHTFMMNIMGENAKLRERLLAMGLDAPVMQVVAAWKYEFGNLGSYAERDLPAVCENLKTHTIGDLMSFDDASITGPQARYAGNKTLEFLKAIRGAFYEGSKTIFPSRVKVCGSQG